MILTAWTRTKIPKDSQSLTAAQNSIILAEPSEMTLQGAQVVPSLGVQLCRVQAVPAGFLLRALTEPAQEVPRGFLLRALTEPAPGAPAVAVADLPHTRRWSGAVGGRRVRRHSRVMGTS